MQYLEILDRTRGGFLSTRNYKLRDGCATQCRCVLNKAFLFRSALIATKARH